MTEGYPMCDPVVDVGHPKCFGSMVPVEKIKETIEEIAYHTMGPVFRKVNIWKCTLCGREIE